MKLKVTGSNSAGNCYILQPENGSKSLILEAGCKIADVGRAIKFKWADIAGCLVTHEHQDHAGHVHDLQRRGINVYATDGTINRIPDLTNLNPINDTPVFYLGDFRIKWFNTIHDAAHPVGYFINHPEMGNLLFITDTAEIRQKFIDVNHLMIEANYDPDHPGFDDLSKAYIERVRLSHLSINQAAVFIKNNGTHELDTITLIHLSSRHANKKRAKERIEEVCEEKGIAPKIEVATPWLCMELKNPKKPNF